MADETGAWMPMYWADYFGDTTHLSTEEHGAYLLLIGTYWRRGKALPDDDKWLATVTKMTTKKWKMVRPKVSEFFDISDGHLYHKRIEKEILKSSGRLQSARAAGKAGGLAKSKLPTPTPTEKKDSVPKGTGADAPPPGESGFSKMARWLVLNANLSEGTARSYLGEMRKLHGNDAVEATFLELRAISPPPSDPRSYFRAMLEGSNHGSNGEAEAARGESRVDAVVERLKARSGQGVSERAGRDDDPVLPAVSGVH